MADIMSPEKRSAVMSRIRGKNTKIELAVLEALHRVDLYPECHARDLPGTPDIVFRQERVVVFVDGDFWHGWRFPSWRHKLTSHWRAKIAATRERDRRNSAKLRRMSWKIVRLWEHQINDDVSICVTKIQRALIPSH